MATWSTFITLFLAISTGLAAASTYEIYGDPTCTTVLTNFSTPAQCFPVLPVFGYNFIFTEEPGITFFGAACSMSINGSTILTKNTTVCGPSTVLSFGILPLVDCNLPPRRSPPPPPPRRSPPPPPPRRSLPPPPPPPPPPRRSPPPPPPRRSPPPPPPRRSPPPPPPPCKKVIYGDARNFEKQIYPSAIFLIHFLILVIVILKH
ncbi:hypothetical protein SELMODRAFT_444340 [Selaginella moellendorffii]|uniref:Pherophorin domain-containing protein n=1 Tax=Selaginella moellendorffii TaxID=88036 RepID=D8S962_SELML|nr:hypothetical protein SELMODRAFT_444340 [Selaginella moellendorffii]